MLAYIPAPWILWDETIENALQPIPSVVSEESSPASQVTGWVLWKSHGVNQIGSQNPLVYMLI